MGEFDEYDDFSDLYGDVELQVSSAISSIQVLSQLPVEDDRYVGSFQDVEEGVGGINADEGEENKEVGGEEPEDGNGSETEDDFDIVLNDDGDYDNNNVNVNVNGTVYVRDKFGNDDAEYENAVENKGNFEVENSGGRGGKESCSGGSYKLQYNVWM